MTTHVSREGRALQAREARLSCTPFTRMASQLLERKAHLEALIGTEYFDVALSRSLDRLIAALDRQRRLDDPVEIEEADS